jgi:anti-sigma B factor antagonist
VSLNLTSRQVGDIMIIGLSGRITLSDGASTLREAIRGAVAKGQKKILLELAEVSYVDSSGIGELVSGFTAITNQGGQLKLLNVPKRLRDLLITCRLWPVFSPHAHDEEAAAISSYK